ncbi:hypothetical protein ACWD0Z_38260 [Streptomyces sp. NPDC003007]
MLEEVDMFWTDCRFEPGPGWTAVRHLFDEARDAWLGGDREAALAADESIRTAGLALISEGDGGSITDFLIRINGELARFRAAV